MIAKDIVKKRIIMYELVGFGIIIISLWIDEFFDIPYYLFGAAKTPINWIESIFETGLVLILCAFITFLSWRFLERIKYLEGFLRLCTFCKRICVDNKWVPIDTYIQDHSETKLSHGLCSECMEKYYGDELGKD